MSGHSKWATIKHKKGIADAKRGQAFTKLIKEITVCAKMGGPDPESNARLRTAILKARAENMPKDNIERAIKKGSGELGASTFYELTYEGYAPGGVAIIIDTLTDNKNRTASDVRSTLTKLGGSLGATGCVSYMFQTKGIITYSTEKYTEDRSSRLLLRMVQRMSLQLMMSSKSQQHLLTLQLSLKLCRLLASNRRALTSRRLQTRQFLSMQRRLPRS